MKTDRPFFDTHELGLDIAERFGFSLYDSMIVSAALQAGCTVLYSEDMRHSQEIDANLLISNNFFGFIHFTYTHRTSKFGTFVPAPAGGLAVGHVARHIAPEQMLNIAV